MLKNAYFEETIPRFLSMPVDRILGELNRSHRFRVEPQQQDAWLIQIELLQRELANLTCGRIFFEFSIPRMGKRADVVLLIEGGVFILEFKVHATTFFSGAIDQVYDYALDLKNFHRGSHFAPIIPVLVATGVEQSPDIELQWHQDLVASPILTSGSNLLEVLKVSGHGVRMSASEEGNWATSGYLPTPTIIEAAQALYQNHSVDEIARSDAGALNLNRTTTSIEKIIADAEQAGRKVICFVTGVPGSGKTLAGLNLATQSASRSEAEQTVFLSGNGPLVKVLREALARDQVSKSGCRKGDAEREVSSFVQNIHHFRDEYLKDPKPPANKVVVFDEAQRAWNKSQTSKFMKQKKGVVGFNQSEPSFLIGIMDRHSEWCAIVCLVGGGQEINTGEGGLSEWLTALDADYADWELFLSDRLSDGHYGSLDNAWLERNSERTAWKSELHLDVSMRSFRAETLSEFVRDVLNNDAGRARFEFEKICERYPVCITRDLDKAREWLRSRARGSERYGLIASSGGYRLRAEGINVRAEIDPSKWFLNDRFDVRSSYFLEEVATVTCPL